MIEKPVSRARFHLAHRSWPVLFAGKESVSGSSMEPLAAVPLHHPGHAGSSAQLPAEIPSPAPGCSFPPAVASQERWFNSFTPLLSPATSIEQGNEITETAALPPRSCWQLCVLLSLFIFCSKCTFLCLYPSDQSSHVMTFQSSAAISSQTGMSFLSVHCVCNRQVGNRVKLEEKSVPKSW